MTEPFDPAAIEEAVIDEAAGGGNGVAAEAKRPADDAESPADDDATPAPIELT
jgi:hypothetical protein